MRKRTPEQAQRQIEHIQTQSRMIVTMLAHSHQSPVKEKAAREAAIKLVDIIHDHEREDRCWYCGETDPKELFGKSMQGVMYCIECHIKENSSYNEYARNVRDNINTRGTLY